MKKIIFVIVFVGVYVNACFPSDGMPVNGREIQQKVHDRYTGNDIRGYSVMYLKNAAGQKRTRKFVRHVKDYDGFKKSLIRLFYPPDINKTAFLVWENEGLDTQFLYLPSLKKIRRISTEDRDQSFMGSDFTLYDMGNIEMDEYDYTDATTEMFDGRECWYYECIGIPKKCPVYGRIKTWTDKETLIRITMIYYDMKGNLLKQFKASDMRLVQGIWTTHHFFMENFQDKHTSEIIMKSPEYDTGVSSTFFDLQNMEEAYDMDLEALEGYR